MRNRNKQVVAYGQSVDYEKKERERKGARRAHIPLTKKDYHQKTSDQHQPTNRNINAKKVPQDLNKLQGIKSVKEQILKLQKVVDHHIEQQKSSNQETELQNTNPWQVQKPRSKINS